ncbi:MAG: UbiA prenyltransferase family protein [Pseudomonadota bacterium]|nr:UbiA prenyltransferase family protein [Pseudomonadota bacterium]MDE3038493.1 UbiA prenyltransferase family protein [Pseudomonadota bacterium]
MTSILTLLRPRQWIKNGFVLAPLFFARRFMDPQAWVLATLATLAFLAVSCAVYIVNDWHDMEEDRLHPTKRLRPLAAGKVTRREAALLAIIFVAAAAALLMRLPGSCAAAAELYATFNLAYTFFLKRLALIDVFLIATGYVLRVLTGCYALSVTVSPWIILTTFLLALFLGFGKRYHEIGISGYAEAKPNLRQYNRDLLDRLVTITGGAALITYAIYTVDVAHATGRLSIVYTVAFVAFGLFRYLQSIYVYNQGGEPENVIFRDKWQLANMAIWLAVTLWILF